MMAQPPAIDFEFFSPGSPHAIELADLRKAIEREGDRRRRSNAIKVEKGDLRSDKAESDAAIWGELLADFRRVPFAVQPRAFQWGAKLNALRGEIVRRRKGFPRIVEQGRMPQADCDHAIALIECAHRWYWAEGMAYGAEFVITGDLLRTYARLREEETRRLAWERFGGAALGADEVEIRLASHRLRAFGTFPLQIGFDRADANSWSAFTICDADRNECLYGVDARFRPMVDQLDPETRIHTLLDIVRTLNGAWTKRQAEKSTETAQQEAA